MKGDTMHYQICTELKNEAGIITILNQYFTGYSVVKGLGYWKGKPEASVTISVITEDVVAVQHAAEDIKQLNEQESVLVIATASTSTFV